MGRLQNNPSIEWGTQIYTCTSITLGQEKKAAPLELTIGSSH